MQNFQVLLTPSLAHPTSSVSLSLTSVWFYSCAGQGPLLFSFPQWSWSYPCWFVPFWCRHADLCVPPWRPFPLIPPPATWNFPEPKPKITFSPKLKHLWNKQTNKVPRVTVGICNRSCGKHLLQYGCMYLHAWYLSVCMLEGAFPAPYV